MISSRASLPCGKPCCAPHHAVVIPRATCLMQKPRRAPPQTTCDVCSLPNVAARHLARSYHHLFPVPAFKRRLLGGGVVLKAEPEPQMAAAAPPSRGAAVGGACACAGCGMWLYGKQEAFVCEQVCSARSPRRARGCEAWGMYAACTIHTDCVRGAHVCRLRGCSARTVTCSYTTRCTTTLATTLRCTETGTVGVKS